SCPHDSIVESAGHARAAGRARSGPGRVTAGSRRALDAVPGSCARGSSPQWSGRGGRRECRRMLQGIGADVAGLLVVVALTVLLVVGITRFTSGAEARARRDAGGGESASSGMFGEIVEIFQPSRTHLT